MVAVPPVPVLSLPPPPAASEPTLTSRRNPLVRQLRALHDAAGRRQQGLLLLEGTHLLQEALRLTLEPRLVLATPRWQARHPQLLAALPAAVEVRCASEEVVAAAASTLHPDGVLLTVAPPAPAAAAAQAGFVLALDRLQDPGNLGTLLRTALAAGVDQVWLGEGADPHQPKVLRASAGAALALPLLRLTAAGLLERLGRAQAGGLQLAAAVASGGPAPTAAWALAAPFDTVSVCFSKGLGAPVGSALCGPRELIARARRVRKMLGGGLRQAGVLAAAALHALDHHVERLADDHANARRLAEGLQGLPGVTVEPPQTNIVFVDLDPARAGGAVERARASGVLCTGLYRLRLVTHLDVSADDVERAIAALRRCL